MFQKKSQTGKKTRLILSSKSLPNDKRPLLNCALRVTGLHKQAFTAEREKIYPCIQCPKYPYSLAFSPESLPPGRIENKMTAWEIKMGKGEGIDLPPPRKRIKDNCTDGVSREDNRSHRKERTLFAKEFSAFCLSYLCDCTRRYFKGIFLPRPPQALVGVDGRGGGGSSHSSISGLTEIDLLHARKLFPSAVGDLLCFWNYIVCPDFVPYNTDILSTDEGVMTQSARRALVITRSKCTSRLMKLRIGRQNEVRALPDEWEGTDQKNERFCDGSSKKMEGIFPEISKQQLMNSEESDITALSGDSPPFPGFNYSR
ncbi:hypothetical protein CEXT_455631 [Caerostris extrusa]|uniref:Uncharacterized protein n=1 Tax=Caerostris extrusa TaxID=172846 RepID=A0AAV4NBK9_CAEEX|nr:hypothetical protein CEXT_455631 [Caerostris extrusa]